MVGSENRLDITQLYRPLHYVETSLTNQFVVLNANYVFRDEFLFYRAHILFTVVSVVHVISSLTSTPLYEHP